MQDNKHIFLIFRQHCATYQDADSELKCLRVLEQINMELLKGKLLLPSMPHHKYTALNTSQINE